jgi:hypothetical protein
MSHTIFCTFLKYSCAYMIFEKNISYVARRGILEVKVSSSHLGFSNHMD